MRAMMLAAALAISYFSAGAQARFSAGITGAGIANFSSIHPDDLGSGNFRVIPVVTASGGTMVRYRIGEAVYIETGYLQTGQGIKPSIFLQSAGDDRIPVSAKAVYSTSQVPLLLRFVFPKPVCDNWRIYLLGGSSFMFKAGRKEVTSGSAGGVSYAGGSLAPDSASMLLSVSFKSAPVAPLHFGIGGERSLRNGGTIYLGAVVNGIMKGPELVMGNIEYTTQGKTYRQRLLNRGDYAGLQLSYFFPPFGYRNQIED